MIGVMGEALIVVDLFGENGCENGCEVEILSRCAGETAYVFWGKNRVLDDQNYPPLKSQ